MSNATNPATVTIQTADSDASLTRERRHAHGANGGAVSLSVSRADRGASCSIRWNVNRGAGWAKGWKATRATEAEALAFATEKWPTLIAWLEKLAPEASDGAAQAFSTQVATMM